MPDIRTVVAAVHASSRFTHVASARSSRRHPGAWLVNNGHLGIWVVALAFSLAAILASSEVFAAESVRIGYSRLRISLPIFAAQELGIFQKNGVDAKLEMYDNGQSLGQALVEGRIDVGGYLATPITLNGMLRTGRKMYLVTTMLEDQGHRVSFLLRRKLPQGQENSIKSIADLKGKKVGIFPTFAYKATLEALLKKNNVNPADLTIQQADPQIEPQLLASGGIDALYTIDPAATAAIVAGAGELIEAEVEAPSLFGEPFPFGQALIGKDWADANPELTGKIALSLDEAIVYINGHPKEAKQFLRKYLSQVYQSHVDLYADALYLTSADTNDEIYIRIIKQYRDIGIITQDVDLRGAIYHGTPLPKADSN
jgi:ABC-type nitrate/sulfonate/bicarbonate transport system substrate-binding protein